MTARKLLIHAIFLALLIAVMECAILWALVIAPADREQGDVQRIFYFHLGSIWPAFLAFFYVLYGSIAYLVTRKQIFDHRAFVAGQVGLAFGSLVLITGPIWAKPTWGIWWTWDARLTSMLVLWLIFLGYVMLRDYIDDATKRERLSAILGIAGGVMVPFVYLSTRWFETQHPSPVIMGDKESGIKDPQMVNALLLALAAFSLLAIYFWRRGIELVHSDARLQALRRRTLDLEENV
ncbi:MAG: cytochrome c biogenesis protein CcsA [Acidobacteria bacterium]|nr:cytochrome c biogenesis protein CcsA [Acidobacteriota bacterium]MCB9399370.1 cytochrome c biogenesis protein CcsA [Acidobacteriota bacterium]